MELEHDFRVPVPVEQAWEVLTDVERIAPCLPGAQLQEVEGDEYRGVVKVKVGPITAQYKGSATFTERDDAARRAVLDASGRDTKGQGTASATITAQLTGDGGSTAVSVVTDLTVKGKVAQFGRGVLADVSAKLLDQFVECLENDLLGGGASGQGQQSPSGAQASSAGLDTESDSPVDQQGAALAASAADAMANASGASATGSIPPTSSTAGSDKPVDTTVTATHAAGAPGETSTGGTTSAGSPVADAPGVSGNGVRTIDAPEAEPVDLLGAAGSPVVKRAVPVLVVLLVLYLLGRRRWRD